MCTGDQVMLLPPQHAPASPLLPFLHPHPNINIHGATGGRRGEYIEPKTKCRKGRVEVGGGGVGGGADKGCQRKARWGGGGVVKVARYGIEGKVSRHISQLLL